ncbi:MAG: FAD-binding oxidoreductase [Candidatus Saganbacteria bacterium]|nr:FAD-binding oxidoreductase [Candidatus Saganbacteria bacterium]
MLKKTDQDIIKGHLEDSSNLQGGHADGLYLPESEADIKEALKECSSKKTPLTISAAETGTTGGCIPFGGWLLNTQKLNKIITLDKQGKFAVVQPGVTLEEIEAAAAKAGLLYPPDPTEKTATIGGNVATNASGGRGYRFGATRDWIRRLKVSLPSGEILDLKRGGQKLNNRKLEQPNYAMPKTKNSAGYYSSPGMDLIDLFIGAEGTLGIVSEIEIGLAPALKETFDVVAFFPSEGLAVDFVLEAKAKNDRTVNFFEYFDTNTLEMLRSSFSHIPAGVKAAVYIEQEITAKNQATYLDDWAGLLEKYQVNIDDCWLGLEASQKEDLFKFRHAIPEHINELYKKHGSIKLATDIAVPTDKFKEMYEYYDRLLATNYRLLFYIKFGHIGENHLHVNLLPKNGEETRTAKEITMKFVKKAVSLGGTVSAEHGIGKIKHDYLRELYGQTGINEMLRLKKAFDPDLILNQNNIYKLPQ